MLVHCSSPSAAERGVARQSAASTERLANRVRLERMTRCDGQPVRRTCWAALGGSGRLCYPLVPGVRSGDASRTVRFCPTCLLELVEADLDAERVAACPQCRGMHFEPGQLDRVAGRAVRGTPDPVAPGPALACADCGEALTALELGATRWQACQSCGGAWVEARALLALTGRAAPSGPVERGPVTGSALPLPKASAPLAPIEDRLPFDRPTVQWLAYSLVALVALAVAVLGIAETLVFFVRLWIHELGHALPAWLSGRAALPLPFGFTFWREESSWFTALCLAFLIGVLGVASWRERRTFGVVLAGALFALQGFCTLLVPDETMIGWIVAGGLAGELVLSALLVVAFYYPLPDRIRWDFWRFVVLLPSACVFASAFAMWVRIDLGIQGLPFGSIVGAPGDGTGDVERLMASYDWTPEGMTAFYRTLGTFCLLAIGGHYAIFGLRAFWKRS